MKLTAFAYSSEYTTELWGWFSECDRLSMCFLFWSSARRSLLINNAWQKIDVKCEDHTWFFFACSNSISSRRQRIQMVRTANQTNNKSLTNKRFEKKWNQQRKKRDIQKKFVIIRCPTKKYIHTIPFLYERQQRIIGSYVFWRLLLPLHSSICSFRIQIASVLTCKRIRKISRSNQNRCGIIILLETRLSTLIVDQKTNSDEKSMVAMAKVRTVVHTSFADRSQRVGYGVVTNSPR